MASKEDHVGTSPTDTVNDSNGSVRSMHSGEDTQSGVKIKPQTYDGTTSWSDYLIQFELVAEWNKWNDYTKAICLAASLRGVAQSVLGYLDSTERHDYHSLVACLSLRFGTENQEELFWVKLNNRVRHPNESLPDLAHNIRRLVKLALPTIPSPFSQEIAKKYFISAIRDSELRLNILRAKPATFDDAIKFAVETEAFYKAEKYRKHQHEAPVGLVSTDGMKENTGRSRKNRKSPSSRMRARRRLAIIKIQKKLTRPHAHLSEKAINELPCQNMACSSSSKKKGRKTRKSPSSRRRARRRLALRRQLTGQDTPLIMVNGEDCQPTDTPSDHQTVLVDRIGVGEWNSSGQYADTLRKLSSQMSLWNRSAMLTDDGHDGRGTRSGLA